MEMKAVRLQPSGVRKTNTLPEVRSFGLRLTPAFPILALFLRKHPASL
jgi:hypothetical protein